MSRLKTETGRYWKWAEIIAQARRFPGAWAVTLPNAPARLVRTVRDRAHPALRMEDGRLEAKVLHKYRADDGTVRGNVRIRFTPERGAGTVETGGSN